MKQKLRHAVEFEGRVEQDGFLSVPPAMLEELELKTHDVVSVRLVTKNAAALLRGRNVSDEEIDRISSVQMESLEQVVKFLLSEGALREHRRKKSRSGR